MQAKHRKRRISEEIKQWINKEEICAEWRLKEISRILTDKRKKNAQYSKDVV